MMCFMSNVPDGSRPHNKKNGVKPVVACLAKLYAYASKAAHTYGNTLEFKAS